MFNLLTLLGLLAFTYFLVGLSKKDSQEEWKREVERLSLDALLGVVKEEINLMTRSNIDALGLSTEIYKRELNKRSELIAALKRCVYGSEKDKRLVKLVICDILKQFVLPSELDEVVPFNSPSRLTTTDKFDILLYVYTKRFNKQAFEALVTAYHLDEIKNLDGQEGYCIGPSEIETIYYKENLTISTEDKYWLISQKIYQRYKGFSVIDELRELNIDGLSGGVSGLVDDDGSLDTTLKSMRDLPKNYDSIWVFYKGKTMQLAFLSFGCDQELKRVCQNIYRYNNSGMLSQDVGYKVNDMIDGSRVVVVRPDFSESWAFFIRKFHLKQVSLNHLIKGKGSSQAIQLLKFLVKGGRICSITGAQGSGKTTLLMALVQEIYGSLTLRVQEMAFELHLRKLYPTRNILTFKETKRISGQKGLDIQKKTDGAVNILGEVATDEVAAWMIQMAQVASLFTLFTHHAKTVSDLVLSLRNSLLKCDIFRDEAIAEEQVVSVINFDIHLKKDYEGRRYIERITEIIPKGHTSPYPRTYRQSDQPMIDFMDTMTVFFEHLTKKKQYTERLILVFEEGEYKLLHPISDQQADQMAALMTLRDMQDFRSFLNSWQGGYAHVHSQTHSVS